MASDDSGCGCLGCLLVIFLLLLLLGGIGWAWGFMWRQWGF